MPLFGSKKKEKPQTDIEEEEEEGLFMARTSDEPDAESDSGSRENSEEIESDLSVPGSPEAGSAEDALGEEGEGQETLEPEGAPAEAASAEAKADDKADAEDLMAAFQDDEIHGDLADLTKELEDVPMAELIADLRDIRTTLPPEALDMSEDVAS